MVVKLLTYYGEEVDIMLIFSPQIPHILSVNLKVSSTEWAKFFGFPPPSLPCSDETWNLSIGIPSFSLFLLSLQPQGGSRKVRPNGMHA